MKNFNLRIVILKDRIGNDYLGIKVPIYLIEDYLEEWENYFLDNDMLDLFSNMCKNKNERDDFSYHITLVNVMEYQKNIPLYKKYLDVETDINIRGIGEAIKKGNIAHFLVVDSKKLDKIRLECSLNKHDFHITLGFDKKDVFGQSKGIDSLFVY